MIILGNSVNFQKPNSSVVLWQLQLHLNQINVVRPSRYSEITSPFALRHFCYVRALKAVVQPDSFPLFLGTSWYFDLEQRIGREKGRCAHFRCQLCRTEFCFTLKTNKQNPPITVYLQKLKYRRSFSSCPCCPDHLQVSAGAQPVIFMDHHGSDLRFQQAQAFL